MTATPAAEILEYVATEGGNEKLPPCRFRPMGCATFSCDESSSDLEDMESTLAKGTPDPAAGMRNRIAVTSYEIA